MKKLSRWFFLVGCVGIVLAGCQVAATPTPSQSDHLQLTPIEPEYINWLRTQPFEPAPTGWPKLITFGLPEGFMVGQILEETEEMESGETVQVTEIDYFGSFGDSVSGRVMMRIVVQVVGCQSTEARLEYFDKTFMSYYEWSLEQLGEAQVLRFHLGDEDGRIWVSGPYLIWISGTQWRGRNPWVDKIAELYQAQPPAPGPSLADWLRAQPFEPASPDWPDVITNDLPEGFGVQGPYDDIKELPSGEIVQITSLEYHGQVEIQDDIWGTISVYVIGSQSIEARLDYFNMQLEIDDEWSLEQINGTQVVHYGRQGWEEGRIWVSGPYLIWLYGSSEEQQTWVDTFVELYLAQPPVPGVGTLDDWLRDKPFDPAPSAPPDLVTTGLPEGFEVINTDFETRELSSGETMQTTSVIYFVSPDDEGDGIGDWVEVHMYAFGSAAGRSEYLDMLVAVGDLSLEERDWDLEQFNGGEVARYGRGERDSGRIWISGPYVIEVFSIVEEESSPWVDAIAEIYLVQFPAE